MCPAANENYMSELCVNMRVGFLYVMHYVLQLEMTTVISVTNQSSCNAKPCCFFLCFDVMNHFQQVHCQFLVWLSFIFSDTSAYLHSIGATRANAYETNSNAGLHNDLETSKDNSE